MITVDETPIVIDEGDTLTLPTCTVSDNVDTLTCTVVNPVDVNTPGEYTVTFDATDSSGNEAVQKSITVTVNDVTPPQVTGIEDGVTYSSDDVVAITFTEGSALLNGEEYLSGTVITSSGIFNFILEDEAGNQTLITFEIESPPSAFNFLPIIISVIVLAVLGGVLGFIYLRKSQATVL